MLLPGPLAILQPSLYPHHNDLQVIDCFLEQGVTQFLLRSTQQTPEAYAQWAQTIAQLKREIDFTFLLHHHADCFDAVTSAKGLQLTRNSLSVREARLRFGPKTLLGYSAHSLPEAEKAEADGADHLILGAIFPTPKAFADHPILGLPVLKEVCRKLTIPVFAIGGITAENLQSVRDAGAYGFCALRAIYANDDFEHNIAKLTLLWEH